ncbi:MAG TPA: phosphate acyltransferase PlsX [Thermoanaerobacterales bacterium]|jgi:glycerol-3-phosphate acyltransferase PlsX|nr:phosphate acyltransferase PlsX [Thermoanaerobacterales bacterium]
MKIILDAMGGDNAPREIVMGAIEAINTLDVEILLVGQKEKIMPYLASTGRKIDLVDAREVISNEEAPVAAVREKKDSSIVKCLELLKKGEGSAVVSAGNTGALMAGGLFIMGRMKGVDRPAIGTLLPTKKGPVMLLDVGANSDVKPKNLVQFGLMGNIYAKEILKKSNPKVGLLNIGVEEAKGNSLVKSAYATLKGINDINFIGNVEARDFFDGEADVVVCDGFTGNIFIKTVEGLGSFIFDQMKKQIKKKLLYILCARAIAPAVKAAKANIDYSEYGGAMFLGLDGVLIKCHGSSDRKAIANGIKVANNFAHANISDKLKQCIETVSGEENSI